MRDIQAPPLAARLAATVAALRALLTGAWQTRSHRRAAATGAADIVVENRNDGPPDLDELCNYPAVNAM